MRRRKENDWLKCAPTPDFTQQRGDYYLLVWGSSARWAIVDSEMYEEICRNTNDSDSFAQDEAEIQPKIRNVALNITRKCNLRCRFCYNANLPTETSDEITTSEITSFLKSAKRIAAPNPSLVILGGEPMLYPDKLLEVAAQARKLGFTSIVSTNGTLVTDQFARWARRIGLQVQVSIDGHDASHHDAVRGTGTFEKSLAGIQTLVKNRVHTTISMVCHKENLPHLEDFYDLATDLGVNEARFIPLKLIGGGSDSGFEPAPLSEMISAAYDMLCRRPELARLMGRDAFSIMGNTCRYAQKRHSCGTGSETLLLDSDGSIYPCLNTNRPEFRVANIRDNGFNLAQTWQGSTVLGNIRCASSVNQASSSCGSCFLRHWCLGGCHGETYALTGDLCGRSPNCADLKKSVIETFWILAERPDLIKPAEIIC